MRSIPLVIAEARGACHAVHDQTAVLSECRLHNQIKVVAKAREYKLRNV